LTSSVSSSSSSSSAALPSSSKADISSRSLTTDEAKVLVKVERVAHAESSEARVISHEIEPSVRAGLSIAWAPKAAPPPTPSQPHLSAFTDDRELPSLGDFTVRCALI
jgi:hypothetical protein